MLFFGTSPGNAHSSVPLRLQSGPIISAKSQSHPAAAYGFLAGYMLHQPEFRSASLRFGNACEFVIMPRQGQILHSLGIPGSLK